MEVHRSVSQFPVIAWLVACSLAVLVVTLGAPRMALASTPLGGSYSTASDAAAAVCGYDWDDLPSDVRQKCMADQLRGFSRFRNTLTNSALDVTVWTSSADGMLYATLVDNARADLREAIAQSNGVGGDGGNFTNYNNNQNNPSGNTGTGGESGGNTNTDTITLTMYPSYTNNTSYNYINVNGTGYSSTGNSISWDYFTDAVQVTITGTAANFLNAYSGYYRLVRLCKDGISMGVDQGLISFKTEDKQAGSRIRPTVTMYHKNASAGDYYGSTTSYSTARFTSGNNAALEVVTTGWGYYAHYVLSQRDAAVDADSSIDAVLAGIIAPNGNSVGINDDGAGGSGGDTYVYSPTTYNNNSNTTNVTNNTTTTTNNTTNTTVNDTTNNTTYNYTTVVNGTQDIDMTPITARLDALNAMVGNLGIDVQSIGSDLRSLDAEVASFHTDFVRFGDWLYNLWQGLNGTLSRIIGRLDLIDEDINALDFGSGSSSGGSVDVDMTETNDLLQDIADKLDALNSLMAINTAANVLDAVLDLLDDLLDAIGGVLDTLADAFGELTDVFPFSIPWDLAIIGGLLVHEPVTPVLDISLPRMGAQAVSIHVDLSAWDGAAAIARGCELILFGVGLALNTREMMGIGDDVA